MKNDHLKGIDQGMKDLERYLQDEWMEDFANETVRIGEFGILNFDIIFKLGSVEIHKINVEGPFVNKSGKKERSKR